MMTGLFWRSTWLKTLFFAGFLVLAGCGGSSSPGTSANGTPPGGSSPAAFNATGGAAKGILKNADVTIKEWQNGSWGKIATATTDADGHFQVDLDQVTGPLLVSVATNQNTLMKCDAAACNNKMGDFINPDTLGGGTFTLEAILPANADISHFAVTPLTTLAAEWIKHLPGDVNVNTNNVKQALSRVANLFGLNPDFYAQLPVDITDKDAVQGAASIRPELLDAAFMVVN